jgi:uncharacterized membrane protein
MWTLVLVLGAIALLTFSLGSHASAVTGSGWAILGDYVHLLAAAAWIGGLLLLPILVWQLRRSGMPIDHAAMWAIIRRYSYLASCAVFVLIATGVFSGLIQLPSLDSVFGTNYGRVLLLKLAIIAAMLGMALFNNRLVHRKINQDADLARFNRQVAVESIGGMILVLVVAVFVQTQPARDASLTANASTPALPFNDIVQADDLSMHVQVDPNRAGENHFAVHLYHPDDTSIGDVQLVRLIFNYRDAELGQAMADLQPIGKDEFALDGAYLTQAGAWDLSIYVRRRGLDDTIGQLRLTVPASTRATTNTSEPWQNPIPVLPIGMLVAAGLIILGLMPFLWHRLLRRTRPALFPVLAIIGGLSIALGIVIAVPAVSKLIAQSEAPTAEGLKQSATIGDVQLTLQATPGHPGDNEFTIEVNDARPGAPATPGQVLLDFKMLDMDMGELKAEAQPTDPTHFVTRGNFLSMGGNWQIGVTLRRPGFDDVTHAFDLEILRPTTLP